MRRRLVGSCAPADGYERVGVDSDAAPNRVWEKGREGMQARHRLARSQWVPRPPGDLVEYTLPLGIFGRWVHALVVRHVLGRIFDFRAEAIRTRYGDVQEPEVGRT